MSNVLNAFYNSQNQIIDVTKECTFEWYQKPKSCYAYLQVSSASGDFTDGETVTGGTSNATATVFSSYVNGGRVYVTNVNGTFQADETITGGSSNQTATVDGFVPERSYTSIPNNITHGTFPDSIISKDLDDYFEWESTLTGAGYACNFIKVTFPVEGIYCIPMLFGVGQQVDSLTCLRYFQYSISPFFPFTVNASMAYIYDYDTFVGVALVPSFAAIISGQFLKLKCYQNNKGTFRWRIHNIRILKIVI